MRRLMTIVGYKVKGIFGRNLLRFELDARIAVCFVCVWCCLLMSVEVCHEGSQSGFMEWRQTSGLVEKP